MMSIVGLKLSVRDFRGAVIFPVLVAPTLAARLVVLPAVAALVKESGYGAA